MNDLQREIVNAAHAYVLAEDFDFDGDDGYLLYERLKTAVDAYSSAVLVGSTRGHTLPFPTIVCLCGSTRFWRTFQQAGLEETMAGRIVLSIGAASGTDDEHFGNLSHAEYNRVKAMLDELHLRKIDMADEILVLNVGGYVGESTSSEVRYAHKMGKRIRWLEEPSSAVLERLGLVDKAI